MDTTGFRINDTAYVDTYLLHQSQEFNVGKKKPLVIVCPGGGYAFTSDREAEAIALKFNSIGLHSVVLWYTTGDQVKHVPQNALIEAAQAVQYIRAQADAWLVDETKIIVCGFSAGGHLALQLATRWHDPMLSDILGVTSDHLKVDLAIAGYPLVYQDQAFEPDDLGFASSLIGKPLTANERFFGTKEPTDTIIKQMNVLHYVDEWTPPMFIWHTTEDVLVDVDHSLKLGVKLREKKRPFEMHIFEKGEHGLALGDRTTARKASHLNPHVAQWFTLCEGWLHAYIDTPD
ncbi:alpha/beta hydrolase [Enterococcus sp. RIT-PI-f]|uniref:alpha/beta hydrolase n=1 Tax=Enterococcus sp. RIT-PI-f TaxID=1690244 RepID=UPI0006B8C547|nr:alpha/beta hydrolase [Enterococcus sp. RIT-PI-f]KPG68788.1 1,4-beta-xylanase [Enterococcus sp. RIT-PI-f]